MWLRFDDLEIDLDAYEVRRDGVRVPMEPQVFEVLRHLVEHRDRLVTKEELLDGVWGSRFVSESALTSRIKAARRALGDDGREQRVIKTVHGRGYRFVAAVTEAAARPSVGTSSPTPLLERFDELATCEAALDDAAHGAGRVVLVSGEAGIGKTTLVRSFVAAAAQRARVLLGACDDLVTPRPLGPLHDLVPLAHPQLQAALQAAALADVQRALLDELARPPCPVVLVVEDVHWADEATIDLLTVVVRRIERLPALVVLTYREGEADRALLTLLGAVPPGVVRHLCPAPLSRDAVATLVGPSRADEVHHTTGGLPLFVSELAALAPTGASVPSSVALAVRARVARLPADTGRLLELLAVEPSRTDLGVLDDLRPSWVEDLGPAEQRGIVAINGRTVAFRHELARRAVLESLPAARRRVLHREVAVALAGRAEDPARVVHHAEAAGDDALLVTHARLAAARASSSSAHREAWSHLQRVVPRLDLVEAVERPAVLEAASREAYAADHAADALDLAGRALDGFRRIDDPIGVGRVHRWLSRIHWYQGRRFESEVQARLAVQVLEPLPASVELAWAYSNLAQLAMLAWRRDETFRWSEHALDLARRLGARDVLAHALVNIGSERVKDDVTDEQPLWDAVAVAVDAGEHHEAVRAMIAMAYTSMEADRPTRALELTELALRHAEEHEVETLRVYLLAMQGRLAVLRGEWDEASRALEHVLAAGSSVTRILALGSRALLEVRRGDPAAEATLAQVWPLAHAAGEPQRLLPLLEVEAERAWLRGDLRPLVPRLREAWAAAARLPAHLGRVARWLQEADALDHLPAVPEPHRAELEGRWADAAADWHERGMPYEEAMALARTGRTGRRQAVELAERLGARALLARWRG